MTLPAIVLSTGARKRNCDETESLQMLGDKVNRRELDVFVRS